MRELRWNPIPPFALQEETQSEGETEKQNSVKMIKTGVGKGKGDRKGKEERFTKGDYTEQQGGEVSLFA